MLEKISLRENRTTSEICRGEIEKYIKAHGEANSSFPISKWVEDPNLVALPTLGEDPNLQRLQVYSDEDLAEIKKHAEAWSTSAALLQESRSKKRLNTKGPVKELDIELVMESRHCTREQAIEFLVSIGYKRAR